MTKNKVEKILAVAQKNIYDPAWSLESFSLEELSELSEKIDMIRKSLYVASLEVDEKIKLVLNQK